MNRAIALERSHSQRLTVEVLSECFTEELCFDGWKGRGHAEVRMSMHATVPCLWCDDFQVFGFGQICGESQIQTH